MSLLYAEHVPAGWRDIADRHVAQLKEMDPTCEIYVKEKFGLLRIRASSATHHWSTFTAIEDAAELESSTTCELCGQPGKLRLEQSCLQTLCDRCFVADEALRRKISAETEQAWAEKHY